MFGFRVGSIELTVVSDGTMPLPAEALFPKGKRNEWESAIPRDANGQFVAGLNSLLVRTGNQTIVVDTGASNKAGAPRRAPGELLDNLKSLGVEPGDVDLVILTHGHWDHYGWNTREVNG
ncbi:MAG: MBL fold metallo-hydrolase, partial [Chloroflexi bacterium]|nr:MBL fold metallo-hydrolase [Chloroflexota bacterium]